MSGQPRTYTHIQCLECGRWLRSMSTHLVRAHLVTAEEYKIRHGLAMRESLASVELDERSRQRMRAAAEAGTHPGIEAIRSHVTGSDGQAIVRRNRGHPEYKTTRTREDLPHRVAAFMRTIREGHDARAREAGYDSWEHLLRSTIHLPAGEVAALAGLSEMPVSEARRTVLGEGWRDLKIGGKAVTARVLAAGYSSVVEALIATWDLSLVQAGVRMGLSKSTVQSLRARLPEFMRP